MRGFGVLGFWGLRPSGGSVRGVPSAEATVGVWERHGWRWCAALRLLQKAAEEWETGHWELDKESPHHGGPSCPVPISMQQVLASEQQTWLPSMYPACGFWNSLVQQVCGSARGTLCDTVSVRASVADDTGGGQSADRPHASLKGLVTCCLYCQSRCVWAKVFSLFWTWAACVPVSPVSYLSAGTFTDCCKKHWPFVVCCREKTKVYCNSNMMVCNVLCYFQITYYMYYVVWIVTMYRLGWYVNLRCVKYTYVWWPQKPQNPIF